MFKKKDLIILSTIVILILLGFIFNHFYFNHSGDYVYITVNNQEYQKVPLNQNQTININDTNTVIINDGIVYMEDASCPDKLCVDQGKISKNGEQIICLPNQVVVAIISNQNSDVDASTN